MSIDEYLVKMKLIQKNLHEFIENDDNEEENFKAFSESLEDQKIFHDRHELKSVLYMIIKISDNHFRASKFTSKIERLLSIFKDQICKYFTNAEIFQIFRKNKRILLYLIKNQILNIDEQIYTTMKEEKNAKYDYIQYFFPEVRTFCDKEFSEEYSKQIPENFEEKREKGENDSKICSFIRNDSIEEFVSYVNRKNYPLDGQIPSSIFETNRFLIKNKKTTLIEYAMFFGSFQVFQYLRLNKVDLNSNLWLYSIHGRNAELIHLLEENHVDAPDFNDFKRCLRESIKCYHDEITEYIRNTYIQKEDEKSFDFYSNVFDFYNFDLIQSNLVDRSSFYFLCKNDYFVLVDILLNSNSIDVNALYDCKDTILKIFFL